MDLHRVQLDLEKRCHWCHRCHQWLSRQWLNTHDCLAISHAAQEYTFATFPFLLDTWWYLMILDDTWWFDDTHLITFCQFYLLESSNVRRFFDHKNVHTQGTWFRKCCSAEPFPSFFGLSSLIHVISTWSPRDLHVTWGVCFSRPRAASGVTPAPSAITLWHRRQLHPGRASTNVMQCGNASGVSWSSWMSKNKSPRTLCFSCCKL